jgi:hypothetical protein
MEPSDYDRGYRDAVADAKEAVGQVPVETWPAHDPYSQTPQTPIDRQARDVRQDCLDAVAALKPRDDRRAGG